MASSTLFRPRNTGIAWRVVASAVSVMGFGIVNTILIPVGTLVSARAAGLQFANSDIAYTASVVGMSLGMRLGLSSALLVSLLALIWFVPIKRLTGPVVALGIGVLATQPAGAYYSKQNYTEAVTIYPNETAFWIPDSGANKEGQSQFDSADYYNANRVALKRFVVPHALLSGSGFTAWGDYYVPSGRLIVVDRTPYNREWTKETTRGTSTRNDSFPCQDNQGHDVTVEMTVGTSITELDAAKFLYKFGIKPPQGDRMDPNVIFTSIYFGRSLTEIMDTVGRGAVQAMVCSEISTRDLDKVNKEADVMLTSIQNKAKTFFTSYGITVDYLGWAGTFSFAPAIQSAIDRRYIADKDKEIAALLEPYAPTIQSLAAADTMREFGYKTDGKLPTTIVGLPANVTDLLGTLLSVHSSAMTNMPSAAK